MPRWATYDDEVHAERRLLVAWGIETLDRRVGISHKLTYKAQTLRELARRLELQELVVTLQGQINALQTECDTAQTQVFLLRSRAQAPPRGGPDVPRP